jgi:hypothetical protein
MAFLFKKKMQQQLNYRNLAATTVAFRLFA